MSEFKVGDRVKVKSGAQSSVIAEGLIFDITEINQSMQFACGEGAEAGVWFRNLEHVLDSTEDSVNHPSHYKSVGGLEVIEVIEAFDLDRYLANVVKYVLRSPNKGNEVEDLKKAVWYLQRKIERLENSNDSQ